MATTTEQDRVRELQRALYRAAKADPHGGSRMPAVKNVGEPCAGEPHARFEVAAGGNLRQSALPRGAGASRRPYIELKRRRVHLASVTANPNDAWVAQQARKLIMTVADQGQRPRFLIRGEVGGWRGWGCRCRRSVPPVSRGRPSPVTMATSVSSSPLPNRA